MNPTEALIGNALSTTNDIPSMTFYAHSV